MNSFLEFAFIICQVQGYQNILRLSCKPLAFATYEAFLKNKKKSRTSLSAAFSACFLRKMFLLLYSINWPNFIALLSLLETRSVFVCNCLLTRLWRLKFLKSIWSFYSSRFFYMTKKSDKNLNTLKTKRTKD